MQKLAIFISGRGSNMLALLEAQLAGRLNADIVGVFSNKADAIGLATAQKFGVPTATLSPADFDNKTAYETAILDQLNKWSADVVALAGYMRLVGPTLLGAYSGHILNIHPSLLPDFKGLNAQAQALAAGVSESGCTVHLVDDTLDGGPILGQRRVPVLAGDTEASLSERILVEEHRLYPEVLNDFLRSLDQ